jgi:hypothetical protein
MNYLAHGYRFLDNPLKLAGTAIPDWLSVVDRQVRVRSRRVREHYAVLDADEQSIAEGILQHLGDDDLFHRCPRFVMLESELSCRFRRVMPDPYDHRPPFLGHIVTELLLDSVIAEENPGILDAYYHAMDEVSPAHIENLVNRVASRSTDRLAEFIAKFHAARVLYDYSDNAKLLLRLNQVLKRVTLPGLDERSMAVLQEARVLLRQHASELLYAVESNDARTDAVPDGPTPILANPDKS